MLPLNSEWISPAQTYICRYYMVLIVKLFTVYFWLRWQNRVCRFINSHSLSLLEWHSAIHSFFCIIDVRKPKKKNFQNCQLHHSLNASLTVRTSWKLVHFCLLITAFGFSVVSSFNFNYYQTKPAIDCIAKTINKSFSGIKRCILCIRYQMIIIMMNGISIQL